MTRIAFPGYNHEQLIRIIQSRLEGVPGNVVDPDAIKFASMKIASVSGDARRALDICRRAVELVEEDRAVGVRPESEGERATRGKKSPGAACLHAPRVTISTIKQAISEAVSNPIQQHLRSLPFLSKLFLASVLVRMGRSGGTDSTLADVTEEMTKILKIGAGRLGQDIVDSLTCLSDDCGVEGTTAKRVPTPRSVGLGVAALELENAGIIILEEHTPQRPRKIQLAVSETHVRMAFRDDPEIQALGIYGI